MSHSEIKRRGLKDRDIQVTFKGKHISCGTVMGFTWVELRQAIQRHMQEGEIVSMKITERGIDVYTENHPADVGSGLKVHKAFLGYM